MFLIKKLQKIFQNKFPNFLIKIQKNVLIDVENKEDFLLVNQNFEYRKKIMPKIVNPLLQIITLKNINK